MADSKVVKTTDFTVHYLEPGVAPDLGDPLERIAEATDPDMLADVKPVKSVTVTSVFGKTEVPESIVDALVSAGYKKGK